MTTRRKKQPAGDTARRQAGDGMDDGRAERSRFFVPFVISLIVHGAVFFALVFAPKPSYETAYLPSVIDVRMVSMPGPPSETPSDSAPEVAPEKEPVSEPEREPEPEPAEVPEPEVSIQKTEPESQARPEKVSAQPQPEPEPDVSLAPKEPVKPEVKKSLKKKTFKPSRVVKSAIEKLERDTEDSRPKTVSEAIEKLRKDEDKKDQGRKKPASSVAGTGGTGRPSGGGAAGSGIRAWEAFDIYNVEIAYQIQKNWAFSEQLGRGQGGLEARVGIKILPDGTIQDVWFDKKSGNQYLDESAIRAIKKSNPLPPLPSDFTGPYYKIGLRFTPQGLTG